MAPDDPVGHAFLLDEPGWTDVRGRLEVPLQRLEGPEEVVEWVRGTTLTAYRERLPAALHDRFVQRYRERLLDELPERGSRRPLLHTFERTLMRATRPR